MFSGSPLRVVLYTLCDSIDSHGVCQVRSPQAGKKKCDETKRILHGHDFNLLDDHRADNT